MSEPGDTEQQIRQDRLAKLAAARSRGIDPYPTGFPHRLSVAVLRERFGDLEPGADSGQRLRAAGRVMARRGHGKAQFLDLVDSSGRIQLHATADATPRYEEFGDLDLGDLIGVEGEVFQSRRGELSVRVESWQLLAKCLRPLPEKWHGLTDVEQRYRHRYVDLITNEQSRVDAVARSRAVTAMRAALDEEGFVEVETPVLQPLYGGGAAKPFTTHSNELERDLYLRIADELYLKRLIVGGLDRVYELGKDFRNESISFKHSPEFTMLEWYQAYADYRDGMALVEKVVSRAGAAAGSTLDLTPPWPRRSLREAITEAAGIDPLADRDRDRLVSFMQEQGMDTSGDHTWAQAVDHLLSHFVESRVTTPMFITDYPVELSPFSKRSPDDDAIVERFEAFCGGMEIANAYSELNDPVDQAGRFEAEAKLQAGGDEEAEPVDDDYVEALEYGLPPTGGLGIGLDRLVMLISGADAIRDVILFPTLRPEGREGADASAAVASDGAPSATDFGVPTTDEAEPVQEAPVPAAAPPVRPRRARSLRPLAWASVIVGLFSLLPTATQVRFSLGHFSYVTSSTRSAGLIVSVAIGLGIIIVARGLARGKRRAWVIAVALFAAAAVVHLLRGPDPFVVLLSAAMLLALIWFRR
ncbi:MAG: lysine--tRNA ligase, partial [Gaiellales bacterium]